jgi:hypothetical protein
LYASLGSFSDKFAPCLVRAFENLKVSSLSPPPFHI